MKSEQLTITQVPVDAIKVGAGRRKLSLPWVAALAESITNIGLRTPIEVALDANGQHHLVFGGHRLAAFKHLNRDTIPSIVSSVEDINAASEIKLREISENLLRRTLTVLDRAFDMAAWQEIYQNTHEINKGGRPKSVNVNEWEENLVQRFALSFSEAAQRVLEISNRTVFNYLKVARIGEEIRGRISLHDIADNLTELLALAAESPSRQSTIVDLLLAETEGARTVAEAIARIDAVEALAKPERWAAFSSKFSKMKEADQFRFFDANSAAIELWMKARG